MKNKAADANLDFNGQAGNGTNRDGGRWSGNHSGLTMRENYGLSKSYTKGMHSAEPMQVGPSATKDKYKGVIATAGAGGKINGGAHAQCPSNPDKINVGSK